jgi:pilus assembly protein FimV
MNVKTRMSVLHKIALVVLAAACTEGFAVGLGSIQVQSALNQPLHALLPIFGSDVNNVSELCPKGKIESFDGVPLARPQFNFSSGTQPTALIVTTTQAIYEPAVIVNIEVGCNTSVRRNYQILLDPVTTAPAIIKAPTVSQPSARADVPLNSAQPTASAVPAVSASSTASTSAVTARKDKDAKVEANNRPVHKRKKVRAALIEHGGNEQPKAVEHEARSVTHSHAKKMSRNVLRLSADVSPIESASMLNGMKLSDSISVQGIETDPQKANELRAAQLRFAAVIRGEDPEQNAENETKAAQEKIQALMKEADQIKQQSDQDRSIFEEEQKKSLHINWFIGLGAVLLVCLIAIIWLARRLHQVNKMNQRPFWDHYSSEEYGDTQDSPEHDDSPFSDTVTEFDDTVTLGDTDVQPHSAEDHANQDSNFGKSVDNGMPGASTAVSTKVPAPEKSGERSAETTAEILQLQKPTMLMRNRKRTEMIEVEEISDAMEEAEFWMSLRDPQRAISVLEQFSDVERPKSPMAWLYLLKLYREVGDQPKFEALLQRFKSHFNTKAPEWNAKPDEMNGKGLEDYPYLLNQICTLWGNPHVARYLENLLFNNRSGLREGFDLPVYLDLIMLANIAYELFPSNRNGKPATVSHI